MNSSKHDPQKSSDLQRHSPAAQNEHVPSQSSSVDFPAIQRALQAPDRQKLTPRTVLQLQRTIGNRATQHLLASHQSSPKKKHAEKRDSTIGVQEHIQATDRIMLDRMIGGRWVTDAELDKDALTPEYYSTWGYVDAVRNGQRIMNARGTREMALKPTWLAAWNLFETAMNNAIQVWIGGGGRTLHPSHEVQTCGIYGRM